MLQPATPKKVYFHDEQGVKRADPYHWLRDRDNPAVIEHLKAENAFTESMFKPYENLKQTLYKEILGRIQETDQDYPWPYDEYEYYFRTKEGLQHDIFCRRPKGGGPETIIFDENTHADQFDYFEVGQYALNIAQNTLCISIDTSGDERYEIWLIDLQSQTPHRVILKDVSGTVIFSSNDRDIWYCRYDDTQRPYQVWCHDSLGEHPDEMLYEEKDERFSVSVYRTMSDAYLCISSSSKLTSETYFTKADLPRGPLQLFHTRSQGHEYDIDHQHDYFYIRTNEDGKSFSLKRCPVDKICHDGWEIVVPLNPAVPLDGFSVFHDHIVLECRREGLSQIAILNTADMTHHWITCDEPTYTLHLGQNWEYRTNTLRYCYVSLSTPPCEYSYDMNTRERILLKQAPVLGEFRSQDYTSERIFATARDGTLIPISLVYKTDLKTSKMPMFLTGYGAYGIDSDPYFSYSRLSLLNRGFIYAIAHIRGGGEYGDDWHEAGRFLNKKNTFTDFIDCAKHLIDEQVTASEKLMISGGSAGGLLMGAVLNEAPHLFKAACAHVPFVDVLNTMMDEKLPLTVLEYEEWGNPHDKQYYDYIRSYAPYENVRTQAYPIIFVTAGLNDPRVPYWEAAKWVARLREHQTSDIPIILKTQMSAGHQGPSGRYHEIKEVAEEYAFLIGSSNTKNDL